MLILWTETVEFWLQLLKPVVWRMSMPRTPFASASPATTALSILAAILTSIRSGLFLCPFLSQNALLS